MSHLFMPCCCGSNIFNALACQSCFMGHSTTCHTLKQSTEFGFLWHVTSYCISHKFRVQIFSRIRTWPTISRVVEFAVGKFTNYWRTSSSSNFNRNLPKNTTFRCDIYVLRIRWNIFACCYFRGQGRIREIRENKTTAKISARTVV